MSEKIFVQSHIPNVLYSDLCEIATHSYFRRIKNKTFLITGGNGFIAFYITMALLTANDQNDNENIIVLLVRDGERANEKYGVFLERSDLKLLLQDVCQPLNCAEHYDYIIHAAGSADAQHFEKGPIEVFNANVIGTENIITYLRSNPDASAVYISSFMVYGDISNAREIDETYCGVESWSSLRACYSYGKRSAEFLCQAALQKYQCSIKIVRPGFVYGASGKRDTRVYAEIIHKLAENETILLQSPGYLYRSMVYVTDLVRGIFSVLFCGKEGETYNISSEHVSIRQFAESAVECAASSSVGLHFLRESDRDAQPPQTIYGKMDSGKLRRECGWEQMIPLNKGIAMSAQIFSEVSTSLLPGEPQLI